MADPFSGNIGGQTGSAWLSEISSGLGMIQSMQQGTLKGDVHAAESAAKLGANLGAFGSSSAAVGGFTADVANLGNIISGIQQGGAGGYTSAGINTAALAGRIGAQAASSGLISQGAGQVAGEIGAVAGPLAGAYSLYQFAKNWQSGNTGADALSGAETGATIGAVAGPVGALAGAVIGGAVGAISSAFGGGRADPETMALNNYAPAYNKNPGIGATLTPSQNYQLLSGVFDAKNNSPGHAIAAEQKYGRMGESAFMNDVFTQINNAIQSGQISATASASQIYNQVVNPYLSSQTVDGRSLAIHTDGSNNFTTSSGTNFGGAMQAAVTNLIAQWQAGALTGQSKIGIAGQTDPNIPAYAGVSTTQQPAAQSAGMTVQQQLQTMMATFPIAGFGSARAGTRPV